MATSVYIFQNEKEYLKFYPQTMLKGKTYHNQIIDMYVRDRKQLFVISNSWKDKSRPLMKKTIVHFLDGKCNELKNTDVIVKHDNIYYDAKEKNIVIRNKKIGSADFVNHVDRYVGDDLETGMFKKRYYPINYDHRYFDISRDRISFILK